MRTILVLAAVLLATSFAQASIVGYNCAADGDGAINMSYTDLAESGNEYVLQMDGVQKWGPAHVEGDFITDTELDPTVLLLEEVFNDTGFAWTGYSFSIGMSKNFTISNPVAPAGWTFAITQPNSLGGQSLPNGGTGWLGSVVFTGGSPIGIGEIGTFGYKVSFLGGISFCTEQIPTPEPATMSILGLGSMALLRRKKA